MNDVVIIIRKESVIYIFNLNRRPTDQTDRQTPFERDFLMNTSNKSDKNDDAAEEVGKTHVEKDNDGKDNKPTEPKEEQETQDGDDNKGDECCICLEELPKDTTKFVRMTCCGNGLHIHCNEDLNSMEVGRNCPLCRAKTPTSHEQRIKQLHPWVTKK